MKSQLTALELHYIIKEFQSLLGSKVDQVYVKDKSEMLLQLHSGGKKLIRVILPGMMFRTKYKDRQPDMPPGFCFLLRKRLRNSRLVSVEQIGFERIAKFVFETKEKRYDLFIELFSDGNIILCDQGRIVGPLITQNWKERTIRGGIEYKYPRKDLDFMTASKEKLEEVIKKSDKETIVKALAIDIGLGGTYAEELCLRAGIDKNTKEADIDKLYNAAEEMRNQTPVGLVVDDNKIVPFRMALYDGYAKQYETYNEALDETITHNKVQKEASQEKSKKQKELDKLKNIIEGQEEKIKEFEKKIDEASKKGELIYHNYQYVNDVINKVNDGEYEGKVDRKNKTVTLDLK